MQWGRTSMNGFDESSERRIQDAMLQTYMQNKSTCLLVLCLRASITMEMFQVGKLEMTEAIHWKLIQWKRHRDFYGNDLECYLAEWIMGGRCLDSSSSSEDLGSFFPLCLWIISKKQKHCFIKASESFWEKTFELGRGEFHKKKVTSTWQSQKENCWQQCWISLTQRNTWGFWWQDFVSEHRWS